MAQVGPLLTLLGHHAVPLPVGETMLARALLARAGLARPDGPIVLVTGSGVTPGGVFAEHALHGTTETPTLSPPTPTHGPSNGGALDAVLDIPGSVAMRPVSAMLRAHLIAGAATHILDLILAHAKDRTPFGKPIGRQQLAVMAEQSVAARIAAGIGTGVISSRVRATQPSPSTVRRSRRRRLRVSHMACSVRSGSARNMICRC
ncbi:hypothetical protein M9979_13505 [Sphingomonas sp. RP10(2022)]|uniref:Uncharacterized protein n=1 Tax=Sphingomonas liriopis TaxID=2949094 RepID=A0A9X2HSS8_9SPHN|nr:hypothetical protein [Sphingomonas liriopis]MCP3735887.1 hypothetical protein [Sphingomonas liriopis]